MMTETKSEFERTPVFLSATGKKHLAQIHDWGVGAACTDRFIMGQQIDGLVGDVDCGHCTPAPDLIPPEGSDA